MLHDTVPHFTPKGIPDPENILNGNVLRNINCYEYLGYIALHIPKELQEKNFTFKELYHLYLTNPEYHPDYPYGNLYTQFLLECEAQIAFITQQKNNYLFKIKHHKTELQKLKTEPLGNSETQENRQNQIENCKKEKQQAKTNYKSIIQMLHLILANPNKALERSYQMVKKVIEATSQTSNHIESTITARLNEKTGGPKNDITPQMAGSLMQRISCALSSEYKPTTTTSTPSVREYQHQKTGWSPKEYRFGTQGQYHQGVAEVSPLFKAWLMQQKGKRSPIAHIYFNSLPYTSERNHAERRERNLTLALHELPDENLAVITLPSDMDLLKVSGLTQHHTEDSNDYETVKNKMLQIAIGIDNKPIEDFYINDRVKKLLYGEGVPYNKENEKKIADALLVKSFKVMGIDTSKKISLPRQQAVFFHFIKYEFTNFIIETLHPASFNMACKDAIDRGGVSSAYYNLMKSMEKGVSMSQDEFVCGLHGAPTLVKGRGMNFHSKIIWNAIDSFVNAYDAAVKHSGQLPYADFPDWLRIWRDKNALMHSKTYFIQELVNYISTRCTEYSYFSFFGEYNKMDIGIKMDAAKKLLKLVEENDGIVFTPKESTALHEGRLGKIYAGLLSYKLLPQIIPLAAEKPAVNITDTAPVSPLSPSH